MPNDANDHSTTMEELLRLIGPVYRREGLAEFTGLSSDQIEVAVVSGDIVAVHSSDGDVGYPAFQFGPGGQLLPRLAEAVAILRDQGLDEWSAAMLLYGPREEWEGDAVFELLPTAMADEVLAQLREGQTRDLSERAVNESRMAEARPLLDRFAERLADLPVHVDKETLFVSRDTSEPLLVFLMTVAGVGLVPMYLRLAGGVEEVDETVEEVMRQAPWDI